MRKDSGICFSPPFRSFSSHHHPTTITTPPPSPPTPSPHQHRHSERSEESLYWHLHSPVLRSCRQQSGCPTLCALRKGWGIAKRPLSSPPPNPVISTEAQRSGETPILAGNLHQIRLQPHQIRLQHTWLREVIDELPSLLRANKPGSLQLLHVVRERSRTDIHTIPHIATRGRTRLRTQLLQNFVPPRVSQRTSNQVDLVLGKLDLLGSRHWHWMSFGLERLLAVPARTRGLGFSLLVSCHSHGEKPP